MCDCVCVCVWVWVPFLCCGVPQAELKRQLRYSCDYIRSGPNHGMYVLKGHLRAGDVAGDDDYEEVGLA